MVLPHCFIVFGRYALDPPVETEMSVCLNDADNETCLALTDANRYTFDVSDWFPRPENKCWFPGLVINKCVPDSIKTSFTVTITGHHLVCSTSHFRVTMRPTKWSGCLLTGLYRTCQWRAVTVGSGGLTTCVAECRCEGDDCKRMTVHIPKLYEDWKICEININ